MWCNTHIWVEFSMWDRELDDIIATRCNSLSSSRFWFLNKQAFMTHSIRVAMQLRFPPVETQINNQAQPFNVRPLPFCSWQAVAGSVWFILAEKERVKSFFSDGLILYYFFGMITDTHKKRNDHTLNKITFLLCCFFSLLHELTTSFCHDSAKHSESVEKYFLFSKQCTNTINNKNPKFKITQLCLVLVQ